MIDIDTRDMEKLKKAVGHLRNGIPRALTPAINRALAHGRTVVRREVRKEYVIKQKDIPIKLTRANYGKLSGSVEIRQGMLPLEKFEVRPRGVQRRKNKRPIFARVKKSGGGFIPHAFMIPGGGPYSRIGPERHPIFKLATISAAIMASQPAVGPAANKAMGDMFAKRLDHEINRVMTTAGGK